MRISHGAPILCLLRGVEYQHSPPALCALCARPAAEARQPGPSLTLETAISYDQIHGKAAVLL